MPDDKPCPFCGQENTLDGPDKCRGADTRIMGEAAGEIERLRAALRRIANGGTSVLISAALDECPINPDVLQEIVKDAVAGLGDDVGGSKQP